MRIVLLLGAALFLGGVAAACVFWAGVSEAAPVAFALGGFALAIGITVGIGQLGNWGVPGDEPPLGWHHKH
ncbi:MAG: hypothetical protein ACRD1G_02060 [Acidimicrobiales bacterium]